MNRLYIASTFLLLILLLSCNSENSNEKVIDLSDKYGGVFSTNLFEDFESLFPPKTYEKISSQIGAHVYESLVKYEGRDRHISPSLAESWTVNDDATIYSFKIRKGVTFHDNKCFKDGKGRELTTDDVIYCLKRLCTDYESNKNSGLLVDQVRGAQEYFANSKSGEEIELPGLRAEGDVVFIELNAPNREFIHAMAHYGASIYPREMVDFYTQTDELDSQLIGTGPFRLKLMNRQNVVILERNQKYWGVAENGDKLPYLDGVKITFEKSAKVVESALKNGSVHIVVNADMQEGGGSLNDIVKLNSSNYISSSDLDFEVVYCGFLNNEAPFDDERVRQAFNYAIDRKVIADVVLNGSAYPGIYGIVPPAFKNYPVSEINGYEKNIEKAKELLSESGFPDGQDFPIITLQIQNQFKDVIVAQEIQKQLLENINVSVSISTFDKSKHYERIEAKKVKFWLDTWTADFLSPQNFLSLMISQNTPEASGSYLNTYRYQNPDFDKLVSSAVNEKNEQARMELYSQADNLMMSQAGIMPVYYEKTLIISKSDLREVMPPVGGRYDLRNVYIKK